MNLDELVERVKGHTNESARDRFERLANEAFGGDASPYLIRDERYTESYKHHDVNAAWMVAQALDAEYDYAPSLLTLALEQREKLKHAVTCMDRWCQRCNKLQEEL